jgi:superfamily II DNA/RNA helicase
MLDMGFIPDVERICKLIPFTRQTLFYSATMPPEIQRLTEQFLHNPVRVEVARPATAAANITQEIVAIPANDWAKREALRRLIREAEPTLKNAIVFCNRKRDVDVVSKSLVKHGFDAAPLHGDLDQSLRTKTLDRFRAGDLKVLVASDVAARGLDIPAVSHIFNFDVPYHPDDYVHRIGRTGRAGRSGHAYMLATPRDDRQVDAIEKLTKTAGRGATTNVVTGKRADAGATIAVTASGRTNSTITLRRWSRRLRSRRLPRRLRPNPRHIAPKSRGTRRSTSRSANTANRNKSASGRTRHIRTARTTRRR